MNTSQWFRRFSPCLAAALAVAAILVAACAIKEPFTGADAESGQATDAGSAALAQESRARAWTREQAARADVATPARMAAPSQSHLAPGGPPPQASYDREGYDAVRENRFLDPMLSPLSTFGLDVDTAAYANVRRFLNQGRLPPADAVRVEELVNYFDYAHAMPDDEHPIAISTELTQAPWNPKHQLAMIGVRARAVEAANRPANRLVFLIDTSGSMAQPDKLPMLQRAFRLLVENLDDGDRVSIVTYAGKAGLALPSTPGTNKEAMLAAITQLGASGATAGAGGIDLAYRIAQQQFDPEGNNRVILATDGDFNVGASSDGALVRMIETRRDQGIFLTVLGLGTGNYQDAKMHTLSEAGDGNYHYIDTDLEARRVLADRLTGTLLTVAKDVKIQVEFNPQAVASYRLIGYESRLLDAEDFEDDEKDAGEIGSGHTVTALYEIVPATDDTPRDDPLRFQQRAPASDHADELLHVAVRYKPAAGQASHEFQHTLSRQYRPVDQASGDLRWAAAVAEFGLLLGESEYRGDASYDRVLERGGQLAGEDPLRREFVGLVRQAKVLGQSASPRSRSEPG